jgi:hypothetical protein
MKIIEHFSKDFDHMVFGVIILWLLLSYTVSLIVRIIRVLLRARTIREKGYPPEYCNVDGEFIKLKHRIPKQ